MQLHRQQVEALGSAFALAPEVVLGPSGPIGGTVVRVAGRTIVSVGPEDRHDPSRDGPLLRLPGHALVPGFVDAHAHAGQTFGKSLIGGEPMQIWRRIWIPLEDELTPELGYLSAKWMFLEALRGGFTTLVNFNRNTHEINEAVHQAAEDTGIRLVSGIAASNENSKPEAILPLIRRHVDACGAHARITPSLCFGFYGDALNNIDVGDLKALGQYCGDNGILLQMHSNEHFPDLHESIVQFGRRHVELWDELGILGSWTLLHHAVLVSPREVELIRKRNAAVSYNPVASQWKGNGVAPANLYAALGVRMGLGTDNTRMNAFRLLDAAESCQRVAHGMAVLDFEVGGARTWVTAANAGGADAAGLSAITGSLTPGRRADMLLLDMSSPEVLPSWDFDYELVRAYERDQIAAVFVDGRPLMVHGKPIGWDMDRFLDEATDTARQMVLECGIKKLQSTGTDNGNP